MSAAYATAILYIFCIQIRNTNLHPNCGHFASQRPTPQIAENIADISRSGQSVAHKTRKLRRWLCRAVGEWAMGEPEAEIHDDFIDEYEAALEAEAELEAEEEAEDEDDDGDSADDA